jgi:hypothetical protein
VRCVWHCVHGGEANFRVTGNFSRSWTSFGTAGELVVCLIVGDRCWRISRWVWAHEQSRARDVGENVLVHCRFAALFRREKSHSDRDILFMVVGFLFFIISCCCCCCCCCFCCCVVAQSQGVNRSPTVVVAYLMRHEVNRDLCPLHLLGMAEFSGDMFVWFWSNDSDILFAPYLLASLWFSMVCFRSCLSAAPPWPHTKPGHDLATCLEDCYREVRAVEHSRSLFVTFPLISI